MSRLTSHLARRIDLYILAGLILWVAFVGVTVTSDLSWPYDVDHFRDMAFTQTMAQGQWMSDPYYQGEYLWYNPLMPAIAAGVEVATGASVHVVYARLGAYLNLLGPIAFFFFVRRLLGPLAAIAATVVFLFVPPRGGQGWNSATYSPWLFPTTFAQSLFYLTLLAIHGLWTRRTVVRATVTGALLGATLLAHSAPSLMAFAVLVIGTLWRARGTPSGGGAPAWLPTLKELAIALGVATVISLPLTWAIVGHYGLRTLNEAPRSWVYELLLVENVGGLLRSHATVATLLALIGGFALARARSVNHEREILGWWAIINVALFARGYAAQVSPAVARFLPPLVPDFHYLFYLRALLAICAGHGFVVVVRWLVRTVAPVSARPAPYAARDNGPNGMPSGALALVGYTLVVVIVLLLAPRLTKRFDFGAAVGEAQTRASQLDVALYTWIRRSTAIDAVFLASDDTGQFVVGPTGRKLVAVGAAFSNPFVNLGARTTARDAMFAALSNGDQAAFCQDAIRYRVTHVVRDRGTIPDGQAPPPFMRREWTSASHELLTVTGCALSGR